MGRKRVEIKPEPAERLKQLCDEENIKQQELAAMICTSPQTISKIINRKSSLTEDNAARIVALYPKYRFEWLMGYDPYKTNAELFMGVISDTQKESDMMMLGLKAFASLCGFEISPELSDSNQTDLASFIHRLHSGYSISRNGKKALISLEEMNHIQNEVCDFIEFKLSRLVKEANND